MKRALQALLISPDEEKRKEILEGKKNITIREGHRDYILGPVMLCCPIEPWCVEADIVEIKHSTLGEVNEKDYFASGYNNYQDAKDKLKKFYPGINFNSEVTIIRWSNVRGKLVEEYRKK